MPLPPLPKVELVQAEDLSPEDGGGFLRLRRRRLRLRRPDGSESAPFLYDSVDRRALDAVVVAAHYLDARGTRHVYLRSALRPPAALRPPECRPLPEKETLGSLWELPAGLVEPDECHAEGLLRCASRELEEEVGFAVPPSRFSDLGSAAFPSAGVLGERHHFFQVEVAPDERGRPSEDGSVLEADAIVVAVPLVEALDLVRGGTIEDGKTEIGLRRLAEI